MTQASAHPVLLDCTFRDGGYYNAWNFGPDLIAEYLTAAKAAQVDVVELGFRFLKNQGFKGPCAYTTDDFLRGLTIPEGLTVAVMANGADLCTEMGRERAMAQLFPEGAATSPADIVRFACHFHELPQVMPAVGQLVDQGFRVGLNLMQISDRSHAEVRDLARMATDSPVEVLYFADSMGGMYPDDVSRIIGWIREEWSGPVGVHTHDNMGMALQNTLRAVAEGATWLDSTVTGMGRGPGNARTEEVVIEAEAMRHRKANLVPLMTLIRKHFKPMKDACGWGSNPYYYLTGKYGIHPTYVQEMLGDPRYGDEDVLAVIEQLRLEGGKKFNSDRMNDARNFYSGPPRGTWAPAEMMAGRDLLILGSGPGVAEHRPALEAYIRKERPLVLALNTQSGIAPELIDLRAACHPVRLMADCETHTALPQPLITPVSMLPEEIRTMLVGKELLDFGLQVQPGTFAFHDTHCVAPTSLVMAYVLAIAASGKVSRILMAGFDGYPAGDTRNAETAEILTAFAQVSSDAIVSLTPTSHAIKTVSVYGQTI